MKWKLIIIAATGVAALGLATKDASSSPLALAVLPLACVYVDALCRNLSIRAKRITSFVATLTKDSQSGEVTPNLSQLSHAKYAGFYYQQKKAPSLETYALVGSTAVVCVLAPAAGSAALGSWSWDIIILIGSGITGLLGTVLLQAYYVRTTGALRAVARSGEAVHDVE